MSSTMIPLDDALARMMDQVEPLSPRDVPLLDADGCELAADCVAQRTKPPFDTSAMDGYALACTPLAGERLQVVGEVPAGGQFSGTVGVGEAVRIFTGAPVPDGASHVVIQEDVMRDGETITIADGVGPGANIRPKGGDFTAGDTLIAAGTLLSPQHIALAASGDHATLTAHPRPRLAILMNGDELALPGSGAPDSAIIASNGYGLAALAERFGANVTAVDLLPDRQGKIEAWIEETPADILVTIGGASVGDYDLVRPALEAKDFQLAIPKVALRPGKPTVFATKDGRTILGLPGNPVSSMVSALIFLRPLVARLAGKDPAPLLDLMEAELGAALPANGPRAHFMRAMRDEAGRFAPVSSQDSSLLRLLAVADALIYRPANAPAAMAGDPCQILVLPL